MNRPIVLVTGGSGLVGHALQNTPHRRAPEFEWIFANSKSLDLTQRQATIEFFERVKPMYVIHLAARVGGLYRNSRSEGDERIRMFEDNLHMNLNVMEACRRVGVKRTVLCLSTCIYPDAIEHYPFSEEVLHNGPPHPSNEGYAFAKRMLEVSARLANESPDVKGSFVCVVPTNVYGPHDNFNLEDGHVLPALVHRALIAKKEGTEFVVRGSGRPVRQFIHSQDLAILMLRVLFDGEGTETVTLCPDPDVEHSIRDVALWIAEATGLEREQVRFDESFADGQFRKTASNGRLRSIFPAIHSFVPLKDGIADTVSWFDSNYENARK
jgi:GDP-L-fucose synthase